MNIKSIQRLPPRRPSGRACPQAHAFRHAYATPAPPGIVRDFHILLHDTYL
ncbi:hypothetical protein [Streptomyces kaempferi]|uniref:Uncharacterized protein n=1 Tax=Streptomyces kaempferi TaxID=333725 RepID=A0ABW3XTI2_9ACTN